MTLRPSIFAVRRPRVSFAGLLTAGLLLATNLHAELTNAPVAPLVLPSIPNADLGFSFFRVFGALILVLGIFLGGVWLYRNSQRFLARRGNAPKLNVMEVRPLGGRQALYVIGYERERYLLAATPTGINLITHLPPGEETAGTPGETPAAPVAFGDVLSQMLRRK